MKTKRISKPSDKKPVRLVANVEDMASGSAFNQYKFRKVGGEIGTVLVERGKITDARILGELLLSKNADLPIDRAERTAVLATLIDAEPMSLRSRAAKVGWVDGQHAFVRHGGVNGKVRSARKLQPPLWVDAARYQCMIAGKTEAWLKQTAPVVRRSSRLQLLCAAVYAAPLVRLVRLQPFAIVLHGKSSVGKSSAMLMAGSLLGQGKKESIPNWNLTHAALQEIACQFNDHALLIDETGAAALAKDKLYDLLRRVTYTYAEGADAARHSNSGYSTSMAQADAKGILITTSEHSFDTFAKLANKSRDAGEIARAFNVPAVSGNHPTIFDLWGTGTTEEVRAAMDARAFEVIRTGAAKTHGGAFKRYVEHITALRREGLLEKVTEAMREFEDSLALDSDVGAIHHAARNFSVIFAGGALAIEAGLMLVKREILLNSIKKCFRDGLDAIGPGPDVTPSAVEQLMRGMTNTPVHPKRELVTSAPFNGFHHIADAKAGRRHYAFKPAVFDSWFSDRDHRDAALRWLHNKGLLMRLEGAGALPAGRISTDDVVSFEKVTNAEGKRENGRWVRFAEPRVQCQ